MDFLNKPKDDNHKKALWLLLVIVVMIAVSVLWQYSSNKFKNFIPARKVDIVIDRSGNLAIKGEEDVATKKNILFNRLANIDKKPLTENEKEIILTHFSDANSMNLSPEEKKMILKALNN
jgi:uncharacterized membrane protein